MGKKKQISTKSYSVKIFLLCTVGTAFAILSDFIRFLVPDEMINIAYAAIYLTICIIAAAVFAVRNSYDGAIASRHKKFAVIAIVLSAAILVRRMVAPQLFAGVSKTWLGNTIDDETAITIVMGVIIGIPAIDIIEIWRYIHPAQTDTHNDNG